MDDDELTIFGFRISLLEATFGSVLPVSPKLLKQINSTKKKFWIGTIPCLFLIGPVSIFIREGFILGVVLLSWWLYKWHVYFKNCDDI